MTDYYKFKAGIGEICQVCGMGGFDHEHPPGTKPKDFVRTEATEQPVEWWMKYSEGNWVGLAFIPAIIAEARKKAFGECRSIVEAINQKANDGPHEAQNLGSEEASSEILDWLDGKLK